jgi:hypothetical protein
VKSSRCIEQSGDFLTGSLATGAALCSFSKAGLACLVARRRLPPAKAM